MVAILYNDLPWGRIRQDWESTSISMAALARKYGIRSATTLERRRVVEQWSRGVTIDGHVVPPGAAEPPEARDNPASVPEPWMPNPLLTTDALADAILMTGLLALECLQAVLKPGGDGQQPPDHDDASDPRMLRNLRCLIRINPDRETLAGLIAAAGKAIETGLAVRRRGAADAANQPASADARAGSCDRDMGEIISHMDVETRLAVRTALMEIRQKRRTAQIAATKPVT